MEAGWAGLQYLIGAVSLYVQVRVRGWIRIQYDGLSNST